MTNILNFNPNGLKVSTRRMRKQFGRFSVEGYRAKEYELNRGTQTGAISLANIESLYASQPIEVP